MTLPSEEDIAQFVLKYLSDLAPSGSVDWSQIDLDTFDFLTTGILDSIGVLEMIGAMEKHFVLTVDFENMDPERFTFLASFSRYVASNAVAHDA